MTRFHVPQHALTLGSQEMCLWCSWLNKEHGIYHRQLLQTLNQLKDLYENMWNSEHLSDHKRDLKVWNQNIASYKDQNTTKLWRFCLTIWKMQANQFGSTIFYLMSDIVKAYHWSEFQTPRMNWHSNFDGSMILLTCR